MDDDELIARLAGGDDTALRELFSRHAPWLAARLRTKLPAADVEDVLQETFLAVWRGAAAYRPQEQGSGGGWLWGIARRQAAMWLRRQGREDAARGEAAFLHASTTSAAPTAALPGSASGSAPASAPVPTPGAEADPASVSASRSGSGPGPRTAVPRRFDQGWSEPSSPQDAEAAAIARTDLAAAVESLGPPGGPERDVWQLLYVEDRPVAQVAELLGVPEGTVKSRGHRARRLLKAALLGRSASHEEWAENPSAQNQAAQNRAEQRGSAQRRSAQYGSTQRGSPQHGSASGGVGSQ